MAPPSYYALLEESATKVTYVWFAGWDPCPGGRYSGLARHPQAGGKWVDKFGVPDQLSKNVDPTFWEAFAAEAQEQSETQPPLCRYCIFSFLFDLFAQSHYQALAGPRLTAVVSKYEDDFLKRGVRLTFFDKSDYYTYTHNLSIKMRYINVVGIFLEVVSAPVEPVGGYAEQKVISVSVPKGTKAGTTLEFTAPPDGRKIQATVPAGYEKLGGVMQVAI